MKINQPMKAKKVTHITEMHGQKLQDDYAWMRDPLWPAVSDQEVLSYIEEENRYADAVLASFDSTKSIVFDQMLSYIPEEYETCPVKIDQYLYYFKYFKDKNHPEHYRKAVNGLPQMILDENALATSYEAFSIGACSVSHDHKYMAYSVDIKGEERYTIFVKDIDTGKLLRDQIPDTLGDVVWDKKNQGFFYIKLNDRWQPRMVYWHVLGTSADSDVLVYEEHDDLYAMLDIDSSTSEDFLFVGIRSMESNEVWCLDIRDIDLAAPSQGLSLMLQRREKHKYYPDHRGDGFFILTNDLGKNFRLVKADIAHFSDEALWQELVPHNPDECINEIALFQNHFALKKTILGLEHIIVYDQDLKTYNIPMQEEVYTCDFVFTKLEDNILRFNYSSLIKPDTIFEYSFESKKINQIHVRKVLNYDSENYDSRRLFAKSHDGVQVPVSIVYRKDKFKQDGSMKSLIVGYGSYGVGVYLGFRYDIMPLLDRGFVLAYAHIRGGDDLGEGWHEDAKYLKKKNTFLDFIAVTEYLQSAKYTTPSKTVITGGSAGGMLMGYVVNERPELFSAAVAYVPFVDVINTMLDTTLPLTTLEFLEWGNPADKEFYEYMKSYAPYENVKKQAYPHLFVTGGLYDPRVPYWEPLKWVAKLREHKTDDNMLVLKTETAAGHQGNSGRLEHLKEKAMVYSFVLNVTGD